MGKNKIGRFELILVSLVIALGFFVRIYRINEYQTFLGDEGRDVRIVRNLLHGNLVFIGPQTSIGNMYLGPMYYYLMAPALLISNLSPVGPAVMIALLGTFTLWFSWYVARKWFDPRTAFFALSLYALSPVAIIYSKSSWNPNPMPFFALLTIWACYQAFIQKKSNWLPVIGFGLAAALQMHYLGLLLIPTIFIFAYFYRQNLVKKQVFLSLIIFAFVMSPLVLFDLKHNFMNTRAFYAFFSDRQTTVNLNPARSDRFLAVGEQITSDMVLSRTEIYLLPVTLVLAFLLLYLSLKNKKNVQYWLLFSWLGFGLLGLGIYKQHIYAHYYGFIYPAIYLFLGLCLSSLYTQNLLTKIMASLIFSGLIYLSVVNSPLKYAPNRQLQRTEEAVDEIIKESNGQPFNFGLIAKQNYDESYRYFFENKQAKLIRGEDKITDQLFVICEDGDACQPLNNPQWQIAVFGPATLAKTWQLDYLKLYRLVHTKNG